MSEEKQNPELSEDDRIRAAMQVLRSDIESQTPGYAETLHRRAQTSTAKRSPGKTLFRGTLWLTAALVPLLGLFTLSQTRLGSAPRGTPTYAPVASTPVAPPPALARQQPISSWFPIAEPEPLRDLLALEGTLP